MDPAGCDPLPSWFSHFFLPFQLEVGMRQTGQREIGDAASLRHGEELLGQSVGGTGGEQVLLLLLGSCTWSCSRSGPWVLGCIWGGGVVELVPRWDPEEESARKELFSWDVVVSIKRGWCLCCPAGSGEMWKLMEK